MKTDATTCKRVCKQTKHVTSNKVRSCWPTMLVRSHGAQCCKYALRLVLTCHLFFFVTFTYTNPLMALLILIPKTSQRQSNWCQQREPINSLVPSAKAQPQRRKWCCSSAVIRDLTRYPRSSGWRTRQNKSTVAVTKRIIASLVVSIFNTLFQSFGCLSCLLLLAVSSVHFD